MRCRICEAEARWHDAKQEEYGINRRAGLTLRLGTGQDWEDRPRVWVCADCARAVALGWEAKGRRAAL